MRVLVAHDGSHHSREMLGELAAAGLPDEVEAVVMTVAERWLPHLNPDAPVTEYPHGEETALAIAREGAEDLSRVFPGWKVTARAATGSAAAALVEMAGDWKADLVAIGALGHSALVRMLVGSVSYKVANEAPCSVRVCRMPKVRAARMQVLVAYDGMPGADAAVAAVAERKWPGGTQVRLLTSVGFGYSPAAELDLVEDYQRAGALQEAAAQRLRQAGLEVTAIVAEGDPKLTIVAEANASGVSAVFLGHNDRGAAYRLFLGTVASAVIPRAECSVEVIRG